MQAQRADRSSLGRRGSLIRATNSVGTPGSMVGRYFCMALRKLPISKRGKTMIMAPWDMGQLRQAVSPKECVKGSSPIRRSPPNRTWGSQAVIWATLAMRLPWVNLAALGVPVVPPVYCSTARSPGSGSRRGGPDGMFQQLPESSSGSAPARNPWPGRPAGL